jgi:hypothetical protein
MTAFEYVDIDYKDGKLGVRFEPKNRDIADAIMAYVPPELRMYISDKRRWIFDPRVGPFIVQLVSDMLPEVHVQIEERHKDLILSLLFGPDTLPGRTAIRVPVQLSLGGPTINEWRRVANRDR